MSRRKRKLGRKKERYRFAFQRKYERTDLFVEHTYRDICKKQGVEATPVVRITKADQRRIHNYRLSVPSSDWSRHLNIDHELKMDRFNWEAL